MVGIKKGFCTHDKLFKGLDKYPDGTKIVWKDILYEIVTSDDAFTRAGKRSIGLNEIGKFVEPKRNEKCFCGSDRKYKKCCLKKWENQ